LLEKDAVRPGYYVQVLAECAGNGSTQQPGVFLNHRIVALQGYGPIIQSGPDASQAGFGKAPLPAGASPVPIGGMSGSAPPPAPAAPAAPSLPPTPVPAAPATPTPAITPHPGFLTAAPPPPPAPAPAAPLAPAHVMTPKAQGATYEAMIAAGWTDVLLVQHGMMLP
jgi:hypothetical protein